MQKLWPIYVFWTKKTPKWFIDNAIIGIHRLFKMVGQQREIITQNDQSVFRKLHPAADYYIKKSIINLEHTNHIQVDVSTIMELLTFEKFKPKHPHLDLLITEKDLNSKSVIQNRWVWMNYIHGNAQMGVGSVFSSYRFIEAMKSLTLNADSTLFKRLVRRISAHEFGHVLGLVRDQCHMDNRKGIYRMHCSNFCIMQQATSITDAIRQMHFCESRKMFLCDDCIREIKACYK